jgi:pimeloyl-ACP methyl ester carboxylesterase
MHVVIRRTLYWLGLALLLPLVICMLWLTYAYVRLSIVENIPTQTAIDGYKIEWLTAADSQIAFQRFGKKSDKTILLVHGTGAWSQTWVSNIDTMVDAGYQVIAMDLPPFGFSRVVSGKDYSRAAQARRIITFSMAIGLNKPVLLGHSFGGGPVAEAVMQAPEAFHSIIFVDAALGTIEKQPIDCSGTSPPSAGTELLMNMIVSGVATQPWMSSTLLKQFVTKKEVVTPERTAIYQVPFVKKRFSAGLARWATHFAFGCETSLSSVEGNYRNLQLPTDIVWGQEDAVTPLAQGKKLNELVGGSALHTLPSVGHIPQIEDIAVFNKLIKRILEAKGQP